MPGRAGAPLAPSEHWLPMSWAQFTSWLVPLFVVLLGMLAGYVLHALLLRAQLAREVRDARQEVEKARREADLLLRDAQLRAREEVVRALEAFEREHADRRRHLTIAEERLAAQQTDLDRRARMLEQRAELLDRREAALEERARQLEAERLRLAELRAEGDRRLADIARMSREEARQNLLLSLERELEAERAETIRRHLELTGRTIEARARDLLTQAIERYAADQVSQITTTTITLPDEEMKGRIIGREGRNIRSLEMETGCTFIIDEAPRTIVISTFDPVRRETARRIVEELVADGRIHPARIEEVAAKVRAEVAEMIRRAGEAALEELQITGVHPDLIPLLGTLHFRTSYSQNVLRHSVEMAHLMGMLAAELGLDAALARRVGLFHDIGKALSHKVEGPHATIGAELLRAHGEPTEVWEAVAAHHHDAPTTRTYAALAAAADAITAARPGARAEATDAFLRRMARLEEIAGSLAGVRQCYAVYAGREIRVFVHPDQISDDGALILARDVARRIRSEVPVVGQLKITVIRETRCVEYVH
ncbi:MAG: ribonuclease Y [Kiritimatiellae bacterium]|nr:ribonuclease Y [Kiritimatiellia bacterium]